MFLSSFYGNLSSCIKIMISFPNLSGFLLKINERRRSAVLPAILQNLFFNDVKLVYALI